MRRERIAPRARPAGASSPPLRPRNSVRSAVQAVCPPPMSANATRPACSSFHALRAKSAPDLGVDLRHDERRADARCGAERPLRVGRDGERCARLKTGSRPSQPRQLDRILRSHENGEVRGDPLMLVLEAAVPLSVAHDVGTRRHGSAGASVLQISPVSSSRRKRASPGGSLTGSFDHGVSWFSRLLIAHV